MGKWEPFILDHTKMNCLEDFGGKRMGSNICTMPFDSILPDQAAQLAS